MVEMGQEFLRAAYARSVTGNPECMANLVRMLLVNGWALVIERNHQVIGMVGYLVHPHFLSGEIILSELFWWVDPAERRCGIKLLREMEQRAKLCGAKRIQMVAPTKRVGQFYARLGYDFVEEAYQKAV